MQIIDIESDLYPKKLKEIINPPKLLYVEGNINNLNTNAISIIGSRNCSKYGKKWGKYFAEKLSKSGLTIISGMALGIDTEAHNGALNVKGKTIAVLPCGLNNIYPAKNKELLYSILENNGTIISEYSPEQKACYDNFLERNRIVSGLSIATLVIEAAYRSGTSVTAKLAKKQGRDVYALPGNIENSKSVGTNNLIKQGAKLVTCPEDIIKKYDFLQKLCINEQIDDSVYNNTEDVDDEYKDLYKIIKYEPIDINDVARLCKMSFHELMSKITMLELDGKIKKMPGNLIRRCKNRE